MGETGHESDEEINRLEEKINFFKREATENYKRRDDKIAHLSAELSRRDAEIDRLNKFIAEDGVVKEKQADRIERQQKTIEALMRLGHKTFEILCMGDADSRQDALDELKKDWRITLSENQDAES